MESYEFGAGAAHSFPTREKLVNANFAPWHRHHIVVDLALPEICISFGKVDVPGTVLETAPVLDNLFETDTGPTYGTNGAFTPLRMYRILVKGNKL